MLAEGHAAMRRAIRRLLEAEQSVQLTAEASDPLDADRLLHIHRPQVLILDLHLHPPDQPSSQLISSLHAHAPETAIVALTMHDIHQSAEQALDAGATGVVLKDTADEELVEALHRGARGERYVSPRLVAQPPPQGRAATRGASARWATPRQAWRSPVPRG
jgi:DNA-binding NarL/FixJ family response regulator